MTTASVTTRCCATKDLRAMTTSSASDKSPLDTFQHLLETIDDALRLDLDLAHSMSWDPACSGFAEAAEDRWHDCLAIAGEVLDTVPTTTDDRALHRMSLLLHFLIETQSLEDAERFQTLMYQNLPLFEAEVPETQQALTQAGRLVDAIVEAASATDIAPLTLR